MAVVHAPDLILKPQTDGTATADTGALQATLAADLSGANLLTVQSQGYTLRYGTGDVTYVDTTGRHQVLSAIAAAPLTTNGSIATYAPLAAPYRVEYEVQGDRMKRNVVLLRALPAPDPAVFPDMESVYLAVHGPLTVPAGLSVRAEGQAYTDNLWTASTVDLVDAAGITVMHLDRVWAESKTGHVCAGRYRLVTDPITGALQVYELMPWWWLKTLTTADYPVTVDPTVVAPSTTNVFIRRIATLSTGRQVGLAVVSGGQALYVSDNYGQTWTIATSPASGIVTTSTNNVVADRDADDVIHLLVGTGSYAAPGILAHVRITLSGLVATVTQTTVEPAAAVNLNWAAFDLLVTGAAGATKTVYMAYLRGASSATAVNQVWFRTVTVTTTGVYTSIWSQLAYNTSTSGSGVRMGAYAALSRRADGAVSAIMTADYVDAGKSLIRTFKNLGGAGIVFNPDILTDNPPVKLVGVDGFSTGLFIASDAFNSGNATGLWVYDDTSALVQTITNASVNLNTYQEYAAAIGDPAKDRILIVGVEATTNYLHRFQYNVTAKTTQDSVTVDTTKTVAANKGVAAPRSWDGSRLPVMFSDGTGLYSHTISYNTAPTAPTITVPASFHTPTGPPITVARNDPDPGDTMSGVYLKRVYGSTSEWYNGTAWVNAEPASPITASGVSWTSTITVGWTAGTSYQMYAATVDAAGAKGPYNATGVVTKASTKPTYSQTSPTASSVVTMAKTRVQGTMTVSGATSPKQYIVKEYAADGATILSGPTTIDSTGALNYEIQYTQTTGTTYQTGVSPVDSGGLQGDEVKTSFTVSFIAPAVPGPTVIPNPVQFPPHVAITADNKQVDTTAEGNVLTLTAGATASGTDAILNAQNQQGAIQYTTLGTGKQRFTVTAKDTAAVASDLTMEVYNATTAAVVTSTAKTMTAALADYTLDFDAVQGNTYELRVRKATTTANTITVDKVRVSPVTSAASNRIERRKAGSSDAWTSLGTCGVNGTLRDYSGSSGAYYEYHAVAVGDNLTETPSASVTAGITRTCWWFIPISDPNQAIPFTDERQASGQRDREFTKVKNRGPVPVVFVGGTNADTLRLSASYYDPAMASPHSAVSLSREDWRQRFKALEFVEGYLHDPTGAVWRGYLEPGSWTWERNQVTNHLVVQVAFQETGEV